MSLKIDLNLCDRCGTCISVCPTNALLLSESLEVDSGRCSECGTCLKICPFAALKMED